MLLSIASESPVKIRHESKCLLSPQIEQHKRTEKLVDAYSSSYSKWNVDKFGHLKSGSMTN